ncbi:PaaI family thioesterase [Cryptosporangium japonicum]|uniref:Thioesterase domain-containing protein n=1 Tax=Cryptosporangium japonicum TaxID=80872 RepID=A0ABN0TK19_9ACTN
MSEQLAIDSVFRHLGTNFAGTLQESMGIEYLEVTPQRVVGRLPVAGNTRSFGLLHGGASCVFAETLATVGAALHAGPGRLGIGVEINATHHRSVRGGWVRGVATAVHLGSTLASYGVDLTDDEDRRICTARVTCILRDRDRTATAPTVSLGVNEDSPVSAAGRTA